MQVHDLKKTSLEKTLWTECSAEDIYILQGIIDFSSEQLDWLWSTMEKAVSISTFHFLCPNLTKININLLPMYFERTSFSQIWFIPHGYYRFYTRKICDFGSVLSITVWNQFILMAWQPVSGYFMPRGLQTAYIVCLYLHSLSSFFGVCCSWLFDVKYP